MKYNLIIRPEAEEDLTSAFLWYENRRRGLGYDFLLQIEAGLKFIERTPAKLYMLWATKKRGLILSRGFHIR